MSGAGVCELCAAVGGTCWPHRNNVPRLLAQPHYRAWVLAQGPGTPRTPAGVPALDEWLFVTRERLAADTRDLIARLPEDVDLVCAVARSGFLPGADVATALHVPLVAVSRSRGVVDIGHGGRMEGRDGGGPRHVLLLDDTAALGREMRACLPIARAAYPDARITRAVVYCHPQAVGAVDLYQAAYPGKHFLQWNWQNAGHGEGCAYDFDGILCRDDDPAQRPLYLPRKAAVPLIVTGRHESARAATRAWLDRWGVRCERLVMRDFGDPGAFDLPAIAEFKARHYAASGLALFAESDPEQARIIHEKTGRAVLCPAMGRVLPPKAMPARPSVAATAAALRRVNACSWRGCRTGCQKSRCEKFDRDVYLAECLKCPDGGAMTP